MMDVSGRKLQRIWRLRSRYQVGLRGQPPAALALDITKNTATITAFGYAVWSCILRGNCDPDTVSFSATDGADMVPLVTISVKKADPSQRWDGFILQCGEDSIL